MRRKEIKNQKGFSAVEGMLILVIVGIIGGVGWYVWNSNNKANQSLDNASKASSTGVSQIKVSGFKVPSDWLTYRNDDYGFSFKHPNDWKLKENSGVDGRGVEVEVSVISPNATEVSFIGDQGGKGGDCVDDQANNQHTVRTCYTENILSVEKLNTESSKGIYFYQVSYTPPTRDGGKTFYSVNITDGEFGTPKVGSYLTDVPISIIYSKNGGDIITNFKGKDDAKNNSKAFFDTTEIKEATQILKTFNLL
jgi:hypothetical protein